MRITKTASIYALQGLALSTCIILSTGVALATEPVVTRAEAVMYLLWSASYPVASIAPTAKNIAPDVPASAWYAAIMASGLRAGIVIPERQTGNLSPDEAITRGELLMMIGRLFKLPQNLPSNFTDVSDRALYAPYAGTAKQYQLFLFVSPTLLSPTQAVTPLDAAGAVHAIFSHFPTLRPGFRGSPIPAAPSSPSSLPATTRSSTAASSRKTELIPIRPSISPQEKAILQVIALTNHERSVAGLPPLKRNQLLESAAQKHADDMRTQGYFSHVTPEGKSYIDRIRATGYFTITDPICTCQPYYDLGKTLEQRSETTPNYIVTKAQQICSCKPTFSVGENLARGQANPETVVQEWMGSAPHRRAILQPLFLEVGVGIAGDVWVENFGAVRTK
ncbi:MAG: CAP domain-containing protein [Candidatus Peregrinibacteria bacterium]